MRYRVALVMALALFPVWAGWAATFTFHSQQYQVGPNPCALVVGDLNADGFPDLVTADRGVLNNPKEERPANNELSVLLSKGKLDYVKYLPSPRTGYAPYALALANMDHQKWPDIVAACFYSVGNDPDLCVLLNLQQENIYKQTPFAVPKDRLEYVRQADGDHAPVFSKPGLTAVAVRDLNGDGYRDVVATAWCSDVLVSWRGDAEKILGDPEFMEIKGGPRDLVLDDFNKDGITDLAVALYSANQVAVYQGNREGKFIPAARFASRGRLPNHVRSADFNGDGYADLAVSHAYTDDSVVLFYGGPDFSFSRSDEILLGADRDVMEQEIRDLAAGDLNGDGRPDLAAACANSQTVWVLLNQGGGDYPRFERESYDFSKRELPGRPTALGLGDFDANGAIDLAVALTGGNTVALLLGKEPPPPAPTPEPKQEANKSTEKKKTIKKSP